MAKTDTANLVKELRADALFLACNDLARAKETAPWKAADALSERSTLQAELAKAKRERDEARGIMPSKVWNEIFEAPANFLTGHGKHYYANHQIVREAHQRAKEQCPLAADVIMAQAFFQAVASERERIAWKQVAEERARVDKLEAELVEVKRERDDALSERDACHTVMRDFRETIQPVIPNARRMFFFSIAEEILAQHQSAEASLAAANERVKELEGALETAEADTNLLLSAIIAGDPHKELRVRAKDIRDTLAKTAAAGEE